MEASIFVAIFQESSSGSGMGRAFLSLFCYVGCFFHIVFKKRGGRQEFLLDGVKTATSIFAAHFLRDQ